MSSTHFDSVTQVYLRLCFPSLAPVVLVCGCTAGSASLGVQTDDTFRPASESTHTAVESPLCINEFVASNSESWQDSSGLFPDWVEIHNPTATPISMQGWFISDDPERPFEWPVDPTLTIEPGGFQVLIADGQPDLGPDHLPFALREEGEGVSLRRADGVGEAVLYGLVIEDFSWARQTDCCPQPGACMTQVWGGTPGTSNNGATR